MSSTRNTVRRSANVRSAVLLAGLAAAFFAAVIVRTGLFGS